MAHQIHMTKRSSDDIREVIETIKNCKELVGGKFVCSEVVQNEETALMESGCKAALLCYERNYRSQNSIVLVTIMIMQEDVNQRVLIVGSGAGERTYDPGKTFAERVKAQFEGMGYEEYTPSGETAEDERRG
jgi:hypothetical protein